VLNSNPKSYDHIWNKIIHLGHSGLALGHHIHWFSKTKNEHLVTTDRLIQLKASCLTIKRKGPYKKIYLKMSKHGIR